ncbi:MAG: FixH family protein [bacterium]|nr:FixH family protein [bacterium]
MESTQKAKNRWRWLYWFGGIFLLNTIIMLILIVIAESNRPQLVEENYYDAGKISLYKERFEKNRKSGWRPTLSFQKINEQIFLQLIVLDTLYQKVSGITGSVTLYRPSNKYLDQKNLPLQETQDTIYLIKLHPNTKFGYWNVILSLMKDKNEYYDRIPLMFTKHNDF